MKRNAVILRDLGLGDQGKGTLTDFSARELPGVHTVVRDNGGSQAAHNVVLADGRKHTFAQFGSATFVPGVNTHLSRFMLVNPTNLIREEKYLQAQGIMDGFDRLFVDREARIITDFHCAGNRLRELNRGAGRHGSCGQGIGETVEDSRVRGGAYALSAGDLLDLSATEEKLRRLQRYKIEQMADIIRTVPKSEVAERELMKLHSPHTTSELLEQYEYFTKHVKIVPGSVLKQTLDRPGTVLFEGAQGALLDETYGFLPYVTHSNTSSANAKTLLRESGYQGTVTTVGILRAYATRHGPGPFVTEDASMRSVFVDEFNTTGEWQGEFRVGHFDLVAAKYGMDVVGEVDYLAITCLDQLAPLSEWRVCTGYLPGRKQDLRYFGKPTEGELGTVVGRIIKKTPTTDRYQEKLGEALTRCIPVHQSFPAGSESAYLKFIERELGVPVAITSSGKTEKDKAFLKTSMLELF